VKDKLLNGPSIMDRGFELYTKYKENLPNVYPAVELIKQHVNKRNHILILGDYDADGLTGVGVLTQLFIEILEYPNALYTVLNNSRKNGNGITELLLNEIMEIHIVKPINLIITVDHGSANRESVKKLRDIGIDVIVTDHHLVPIDENKNVRFSANVFINPQDVVDSNYKKISGCAVGFFLAKMYVDTYCDNYDQEAFNNMLGLVAISTIADAMDMTDDLNRFLTTIGLRVVSSSKSYIWSQIRQKMLFKRNVVTSEDVSFYIAPVINSASRMDMVKCGTNVVTTINNSHNVEKTLSELISVNTLRKKRQQNLLRTINPTNTEYCVVELVENSGGVNGVLASIIGNNLNKPIIIFHETDKGLQGSGRAIVDFDINRVLKEIDSEQDYVINVGGHKGASGITIKHNSFEEFKKEFINKIKELKLDYKSKQSHIIKLKPSDITYKLYLLQMDSEPYGLNYNKLVFNTELKISNLITLGKGNFFKMKLTNDSCNNVFDGVFFSTDSDKIEYLKKSVVSNATRSIDYTLSLGKDKNTHFLQLNIVDIH
jgi:single-stranded-DNA-specific exonuclease